VEKNGEKIPNISIIGSAGQIGRFGFGGILAKPNWVKPLMMIKKIVA